MKRLKRVFVVLISVLLVCSSGQLANAVDPVEPSPEVAEQVEPETGTDETPVVSNDSEEQDQVDPGEPGKEPGVVSEIPDAEPTEPGAVEGGVAPEVLPVTGKLVEVPSEPTMESVEKQEQQRKDKKPREQKAPKEKPIEDERFELAPEFQPEFEIEADEDPADESLEMSPGMTLLATESGQVFPVDEAALSAELVPGVRVSAGVVLPVEAREAVQETMDETPGEPVATDELVEVAATAVAESGQLVTLTDERVLPDPTAFAGGVVGVKAHSANVVYFTNNKVSQEANIRGVMTKVSNYWKKESEGKINGIAVNAVKQVTAPAKLDVCDFGAAWDVAAEMFPKTNYFDASQSKHLTVFIDKSCATAAGGWGTGSDHPHEGGYNYVNLFFDGKVDFAGWPLSATIHEFGHNFGFDHSNDRFCNSYSDAAPSNVAYVPFGSKSDPSKLCEDTEYSDAWSPLGNSANSASLPFVMKTRAGFLATPAVVTEKGGSTQRFTLQALSATSGLRGIRVKHSAGSEEFTLEYRSGTGQDAKAGNDSYDKYRKGVRAVKMVNRPGGVMSTAVYGPYLEGMKAGGVLHPYGGRARVTVESMTSAEAKVRVDFSTSFTDVLLNDNFAGSIQWMYDNKISTGTRKPDNTALYGPKVDVSREAMAAFLFRGYAPATYKPGAKGKLPFTDISTSHAFYKEIYWMWERGITTGTKQANGTVKYLPSDRLSREAMAAFLFRVKKASYTPPAKSPFVDVPTTSQFYKHVTWMYTKGVSTGTVTPKGRVFEPKVNTTREATAAFMQRASKV